MRAAYRRFTCLAFYSLSHLPKGSSFALRPFASNRFRYNSSFLSADKGTGMSSFTTNVVDLEKPDDLNVIVGMTHFILTCDSIHEALVASVPNIAFGLAFCEASGDRLVRWTGTDDKLIELAKTNAKTIACGHSFVLFLGAPTFPINVLKTLQNVPVVCNIFCATANKVQVVVAETEAGRGIMGVIDGQTPLGVETEEDVKNRKQLVKDFGYKV